MQVVTKRILKRSIILGIALLLATFGIMQSFSNLEANAAMGLRVCRDENMQKAYRMLRSRNRLVKGYFKNQTEYITELSSIAQAAHKERKLRESVFFISSAVLPLPTLFKSGKPYAEFVMAGLTTMTLAQTVNGLIFVKERKPLEFDASDDMISSIPMMMSTGDVIKRIQDRIEFFEQQHQALHQSVEKAQKQYPSGAWGRIRNRLVLGGDDDEYLEITLAEAKYRSQLYEHEISYTHNAMVGIRDVCAVSEQGGSRLDRRDLLFLIHLI